MRETSVPQTKPPPGFRSWLDPYRLGKESPYDFDRVETWSALGGRSVEAPRFMERQRNVAGLYWKPTAPAYTQTHPHQR